MGWRSDGREEGEVQNESYILFLVMERLSSELNVEGWVGLMDRDGREGILGETARIKMQKWINEMSCSNMTLSNLLTLSIFLPCLLLPVR